MLDAKVLAIMFDGLALAQVPEDVGVGLQVTQSSQPNSELQSCLFLTFYYRYIYAKNRKLLKTLNLQVALLEVRLLVTVGIAHQHSVVGLVLAR